MKILRNARTLTALGATFCLVLSLAACRTTPAGAIGQTESLRQEGSAALSTGTEVPETSLPGHSVVPSETADVSAAPIHTVCTHTFRNQVTPATCTKQGFTKHTCAKCGYSYKDTRTPARHDYGKYLCLVCGLPDPTCPVYSMNAWIRQNFPIREISEMHRWVYREGANIYSISHHFDTEYALFSYENESRDESLGFILDNSEICSITYSNRQARATITMKKADISSAAKLKLENFCCLVNQECTEEEFAAAFSGRIDSIMTGFQNKMLLPRIQFQLKDLGFTQYR